MFISRFIRTDFHTTPAFRVLYPTTDECFLAVTLQRFTLGLRYKRLGLENSGFILAFHGALFSPTVSYWLALLGAIYLRRPHGEARWAHVNWGGVSPM